MIGGRQGAAQKGYLDSEVTCSSVGQKVTIRVTEQGVIVCKYPWQKCKARKENDDRDHCLMTKLIEDVPKEVEHMKKERQDHMSKALITYLVFKGKL